MKRTLILIRLLIKRIENTLFNKLILPTWLIVDLQYQKMNNIWHMESLISH